jgi:regulator of protease activity HflC (stomatin/prohibitin superfamily)
MKKVILGMAVLAAVAMTGCARVETGEVGLRVGFDKQVQQTELQPGSFNQDLIGEVLVFPVKQISMQLDKLQPQTADHSTLADLDITVIYNINPSSVFELYTTESRGFHAVSGHDTYLMYNYLSTIANSASFKAIAKYNAMDATNQRSQIEVDIVNNMNLTLAAENLTTKITIAKVIVKNLLPDPNIIASANAVITAQNEQNAKRVAVGTAKLEADRAEMLSQPKNLEYMKVQAELNISEGVRDGKVQTILIPHGMTMYGNSK